MQRKKKESENGKCFFQGEVLNCIANSMHGIKTVSVNDCLLTINARNALVRTPNEHSHSYNKYRCLVRAEQDRTIASHRHS